MSNNVKSRNGMTLIEIIVMIVILSILAAMIVPIINGFIETANKATDNANARLIYNAAAIWFSENNAADPDLLASDVTKYLGLSAYPDIKSLAFGGSFSVAVALSGVITVKTSKPATYDSSSGKLKP